MALRRTPRSHGILCVMPAASSLMASIQRVLIFMSLPILCYARLSTPLFRCRLIQTCRSKGRQLGLSEIFLGALAMECVESRLSEKHE